MRPIKFRAYNTITGAMLDIFDSTTQLEWYLPNMKAKGWVFMQFTGLCDKKKKEAYEADIIQTFYDDGRKGDVGYLKCTNLGSLYLIVKSKPRAIPLHVYAEWEIIGNLHEHPHLLK